MATLHDLNVQSRNGTAGVYPGSEATTGGPSGRTSWSSARRAYHAIGEAKRTLIGLVTMSLGLFWSQLRLADLWGGDFSAYGSMLTAASLLAALYYILIRYGHAKLDPIGQLRAGNVAVALYFLTYALLVVAAAVAFKP